MNPSERPLPRRPGRDRMSLPPELDAMLEKLAEHGRPLLVGGCVRDWILGDEPKDFDVEMFGASLATLAAALREFGPTDVVGRQFGVIKVRVADREYDFSLPRKEVKTGAGHRGFSVQPDPDLPVEKAALRRDFTINALSYDPRTNEVLDPAGGLDDLRARRLRHVGPAFAEDPLRVLRGFQLAARFDLALDPETASFCRSIRNSFAELPKERIWGEWEKWAAKSVIPSRGLTVLAETGWLEHFPEIAAMDGVPQDPEWHPEGDVLTHTNHCLDSLAAIPDWRGANDARRRNLMLAVLLHDCGKPSTTQLADKNGARRWISPRHESEGSAAADRFLCRIGAPNATRAFVAPLVRNHLYHIHMQEPPRPSAIRRLARRLHPATIEDLCLVMLADVRGRPPIAEKDHPGIRELREGAQRLHLEDRAPKPLLLGRHLLAEGLKPGPHFKRILDALFEAQIEGAFATEEEARRYLGAFLQDPENRYLREGSEKAPDHRNGKRDSADGEKQPGSKD